MSANTGPQSICRKVLLPLLPLVDPTFSETESRVRLSIQSSTGRSSYFLKPHQDFQITEQPYFPAILESDGSLWTLGNLYILSRLKDVRTPSVATLDAIANDLMTFKRFVDALSLDLLDFPKRKLLRPTYRYRTELRDLMEAGRISPNTASRRMSSVISFYRWMEKRHDWYAEYPSWQEREVSISFLDSKGFQQLKSVKTTDLAVSVPKDRNDFSGRIQDGGQLRPLERKEQELLVAALRAGGNVEMMLAFLIALTTGARIQTVFTLRLKSILLEKGESHEYPFAVGPGSGVDTKFHKQMTLFMPRWLRNRLWTYQASQRAQKRREASKHHFNDTGDQYLFLTRQGFPYYVSETDPSYRNYRRPPNGGTVREFISSRIEPEILKLGGNLTFRFHDLRATFGLNLLEDRVKEVEAGKASLFEILMLIKTRMGHSSLKTTERYLEFRKKFHLAVSVQSEFEKHLMSLSEMVLFNEGE